MDTYFHVNKNNIFNKIADAKWIWGGQDPRPVNNYRLFRKEFRLDAFPEAAEITIYAEARYKLYINGQFIQVGPAPSQPEERLFDNYTIKDYLTKGANCIGIEVYCPGLMTGQWTMVNPGVIAAVSIDYASMKVSTDSSNKEIGAGDGDMAVEDNAKMAANTGYSWKTIHADAWKPNTQLCPYAKGFYEYKDMSMYPSGWSEPGYDDSKWQDAIEMPFYPYSSEEKAFANYMGYPTLFRHKAVKLLSCGGVSGVVTAEMKEKSGGLYKWVRNRWRKQMGNWPLGFDAPLPEGERFPEPVAELAAFEDRIDMEIQAEKNEEMLNSLPVRITVPETGDPFLIFDFEIVRCGLISIDIESWSGGIADVAWDDRIDANGDVTLYRSTPNCDRVIVTAGRCQWDSFFERGLRYIKIIFRGFKGDFTLRGISVRETLISAPLERAASFECSDKLLQDIWRASFNTVRGYMNGCGAGDPIREKCHWFGDDSLSMRMAFYCFGEWKSWRRGLELTAQSQNRDGSFPVVSPGHFEDYNMVTGSCSWAAQVKEYYEHTGDVEFAREMMDHINRHIEYELRYADNSGLLYETPGRRFLSWADGDPKPPYKKGEVWEKQTLKRWGDFFDPPTCGYNAIINSYWLWCLKESAVLANSVGLPELSERYDRIFQTALPRFYELFQDATTGLFRDNVTFDNKGRKNEPAFCESTLFTVISKKLVDSDKAMKLYNTIMDSGFICCRSSGGLELSAVPVMLLKNGKTKEALEMYRDLWGSPVTAGATTCGEEFYRSEGNSDCHIHGAAPARDFLEYIAGIRVKASFFKEVLIVPPENLKEIPDFKAMVPTFYGNIEVNLVSEKNCRKYSYRVPDGCRCFVGNSAGGGALSPNAGELIL